MQSSPVVTWICVGCMLLATSIPAQKQVFVPASAISFAISTERSDCGVWGTITVKYQTLNVSSISLYEHKGPEHLGF